MLEFKFCPVCGTTLVSAVVDERERAKCQSDSCSFVHWDNPVPVVAAVIEHEGKVLLARNKAWGPKMFGLVTGFLEKGEPPDQAVVREVREETGLEGRVAGLVGVYPYFEMNQVIIAYHVETTGELTLGDEIAETRLIPPEKVRPWPMGTGQALKDWLDRRVPSG
jgi:NADH pyrophosphatase NudC (nudix superfamily)